VVLGNVHVNVEVSTEVDEPTPAAKSSPFVGSGAVVDSTGVSGWNLNNPKVVSILKSGCASKGISSQKYSLHVSRIIHEFTVRMTKFHYPKPTEALAYILATAELETGRFVWMAEIGGPSSRYAPYYGRGYVQLTWKNNYVKYNQRLHAEKLLTANQNIVTNPNFLSSNSEQARDCMAFIIIDGMTTGAFTGKKLGDYINAKTVDYAGARRIVNGTNKAALIAGYARAWASILNRARNAK